MRTFKMVVLFRNRKDQRNQKKKGLDLSTINVFGMFQLVYKKDNVPSMLPKCVLEPPTRSC